MSILRSYVHIERENERERDFKDLVHTMAEATSPKSAGWTCRLESQGRVEIKSRGHPMSD